MILKALRLLHRSHEFIKGIRRNHRKGIGLWQVSAQIPLPSWGTNTTGPRWTFHLAYVSELFIIKYEAVARQLVRQ